MNIIHPGQLNRADKGPKTKPYKKIALVLLVLLLLFSTVSLISSPLPTVSPSVNALAAPSPTTAVDVPWPAYGQAAIGATSYDVLAVNGVQAPVPTASVAKVATALAVLKAKPLKSGEQGPMITIGQEDVDSYHNYVSEDGSVVPVNFGEQISEYQALQALLLPSANNMAFTLVHWAFGSVETYNDYANKMVLSLGLIKTRIADESGFSAGTVSTAHDLVLLGEAAMREPVLAEIVGQSKAVIPVAGTINNVNSLLGTEGLVGIKTGNTNEAGGCYLFAAPYKDAGGKKITLVGAIMGAPTLGAAMKDALPILKASQNGFENVKFVSKGQVVGSYAAPWGAKTDAVVSEDLSLLAWKGTKATSKTVLWSRETPANAGAQAGQITSTAGAATGTVLVTTKTAIGKPSLWWRLKQKL